MHQIHQQLLTYGYFNKISPQTIFHSRLGSGIISGRDIFHKHRVFVLSVPLIHCFLPLRQVGRAHEA